MSTPKKSKGAETPKPPCHTTMSIVTTAKAVVGPKRGPGKTTKILFCKDYPKSDINLKDDLEKPPRTLTLKTAWKKFTERELENFKRRGLYFKVTRNAIVLGDCEKTVKQCDPAQVLKKSERDFAYTA